MAEAPIPFVAASVGYQTTGHQIRFVAGIEGLEDDFRGGWGWSGVILVGVAVTFGLGLLRDVAGPLWIPGWARRFGVVPSATPLARTPTHGGVRVRGPARVRGSARGTLPG